MIKTFYSDTLFNCTSSFLLRLESKSFTKSSRGRYTLVGCIKKKYKCNRYIFICNTQYEKEDILFFVFDLSESKQYVCGRRWRQKLFLCVLFHEHMLRFRALAIRTVKQIIFISASFFFNPFI